MAERPQLLVYCQHLKGAGHYVRARELARACAQHFDVCLVSGGRPVPRPDRGAQLEDQRAITGLWRPDSEILPIDPGRDLRAVMLERSAALQHICEQKRPDVVIVEHFPFSKWFLEQEILGMIEAARALNPHLIVVSSIRDYPLGHEGKIGPQEFGEKVSLLLNQHFHLLMVHADPGVVTLDQQFDWLGDLRIPIHYTGYISEDCSPGVCHSHSRSEAAMARGDVVVSSGGLWDGWRLASLAIQAWWILHRQDALQGRRMQIFAGLDTTPEQLAEFKDMVEGGPFVLQEFGSTFLDTLSMADLSISQGGYNTTMNLLRTGVRAIVAPNCRTQDQWPRARRLQELGVLTCMDPEATSPAQLAAMMEILLAKPPCRLPLCHDGAAHSAEFLFEQCFHSKAT